MIDRWLKKCYQENQLHLWMLNCLSEEQFVKLVTKKQEQQSKIELQQKTINQIIAKDVESVYLYVDNILHKPFPAGEPVIATDPYWKNEYETRFKVKI